MTRDPLALLAAVHEIALTVSSEDPAQLRQRQFDAVIDADPQYTWVPRARRITELLGLPWAMVLDIAAAPPHRHAHRLGIVRGDPDQDWLTDELIAYALRLVARRLNTSELAYGAYDAEREVLLARWTGRARDRQPLLPSSSQIAQSAGSWPAALSPAGLRPVTNRPPLAEAQSFLETLDECLEAHGVEPSWKELDGFARANRIPFPRKPAGVSSASVLEDWRRWRVERGLPLPEPRPHKVPRNQRPDFATPMEGFLREQPRRGHGWSREVCVSAVVRYLRELRPGERPTQRHYDIWKRRQPDRDELPWSSNVGRHGGWGSVRAEASARLTSGR